MQTDSSDNGVAQEDGSLGEENLSQVNHPSVKRSNHYGDILVVDDVTDNLRVLSNILSGQGYQVRCVKSGSMALIGAKAAPPDLILLDVRMPGLNGYQVCQQLKSDPQTADIPIIFLSALNDAVDKSLALEVGAVDYISKPFQMEDVLLRVKNQMMGIYNLKKQTSAQRSQPE